MRPSDGPPARLRADLQLSEEDGGVWRIADPVLGRQMRFAGQESRMLAALRGEPDMAQPVEEDFLQALERLHLLEGRGPSLPVVARMRRLLLTPLTDRPVRSQPLSPTQAAQAQLLFCPEVRYRCAGCGICCHSFLLGPLRSPDVDRLERLRWPAGARLPVGRQALHYLEDEGEAVPFLRTFKGRCVFLGSEGLCEIHRQEGGELKPLVCRLFPYTFTRLGQRASAAIAVSLQFESMALWEGHASSPGLAEAEPELRRLLAELGSVPALPESVALCDQRRLPLRRALQLDAAALAALELCPPQALPSVLARQVLAPLRALLEPRPAASRQPQGRGSGSSEPSPPLPPIDRWLEAQLAWQQEIESGLVALLPETLSAQRELLLALERRQRGGRPGRLADAEPAAFFRSWLRAAIHGRDAYRSADLLGGWLRSLLRIAVTALLAGSDPREDGDATLAVSWITSAIRASKLFQVGHSPDRPALALLADLPPHHRAAAVLAWLEELERSIAA